MSTITIGAVNKVEQLGDRYIFTGTSENLEEMHQMKQDIDAKLKEVLELLGEDNSQYSQKNKITDAVTSIYQSMTSLNSFLGLFGLERQ